MVIRKCVTDAIDGGKMAEKLSKIPCIHVAGTKVLENLPRFWYAVLEKWIFKSSVVLKNKHYPFYRYRARNLGTGENFQKRTKL